MTSRLLDMHARVRRALARIDPNDDKDAEPLGLAPLIALAAAIAVSLSFLAWRYQPMQDLGHHLAMAAVVADWGRPGSLYTGLYERIDPTAANSLMYTVAGYAGRLVGVTAAVRGCVAFYLAGLPVAVLWALRTFGRSAWGAVLAVALAYNMSFVAGFANMLFAAPFFVLAIPVFYRALHSPSRARWLTAAALFVLVFLGHAHLFLWLGVLCFTITLAHVVVELARDRRWEERWREVGALSGRALACVAPSLLLLAHWYTRAFGAGREAGGVLSATASAEEGFGAWYEAYSDQFSDLSGYSLKTLVSDEDLALLALLAVVVAAALVLARLHRLARPPVLELCCALTFVSYFFLPEGLAGHDVLASRQPGIALWFLPAFVSPVPPRVSRAARLLVVGGILVLTGAWLDVWHENLLSFELREVAGLHEVLAAAPPRQRLHYVKLSPESEYFPWNTFWHVDKFYMADKFGQVADNPALLSTSAIRYRKGVAIHRITTHSDAWPYKSEIWDNFDLILVHQWDPDPEDLEEAELRGRLLKAAGPWQLWEARRPAATLAPAPP